MFTVTIAFQSPILINSKKLWIKSEFLFILYIFICLSIDNRALNYLVSYFHHTSFSSSLLSMGSSHRAPQFPSIFPIPLLDIHLSNNMEHVKHVAIKYNLLKRYKIHQRKSFDQRNTRHFINFLIYRYGSIMEK